MDFESLENNCLKLKVNHYGAELSSVIDNKSGFEYIWQAGDSWKRHSPVLFPIVGRLINNTFLYERQNYQLNQHGFARDLTFSVISKSTQTLTFNLKSNSTTLKNYPFNFSFDISYELIENKIVVSFTIHNTGNNLLLFSIGAHPAFNTNFNKSTINDYDLIFNLNELNIQQIENGLRTTKINKIKLKNNRLKLHPDLFNNDALILADNQIKTIELRHRTLNHSIKLNCNNWPYFGIWAKLNSNDFICLEPWFGVTDHINHNQLLAQKEGIIGLPAHEIFSCQYSITFSTNN